jgi:hypothetical protein
MSTGIIMKKVLPTAPMITKMKNTTKKAINVTANPFFGIVCNSMRIERLRCWKVDFEILRRTFPFPFQIKWGSGSVKSRKINTKIFFFSRIF